uniref:Ig-like domain-containing protein n=1 Tax=Acanthochromis polyacanthus TaxID=80966 RepID=A0A3Q1GSB3_9TELE
INTTLLKKIKGTLFNLSIASNHDQVHQNPPDMYRNPGQSVQISCSHSIDNYDRIYWYKQLENRQLQLLGYMQAGIKFPEKELDVNMEMGGSADKGETCTLTINSLSESSSAVYFCAASFHSATYH